MHQQAPEWMETFGGIIVFFVALGIGLAISLVVCFLLYDAQKRVPPQFRQIEPGMIWLIMIPCFNLIWNFIALPKISRSYKAYFDSIGRTDVETCGEGLAMGYAVCAACGLIPCVGSIASLAGLVVLILFLVKILGLKGEIPDSDQPVAQEGGYSREE